MSTFRLDNTSSIVDPADRRRARLALDLHDGPLQDLAYLVADIRLFRDQLRQGLSDPRVFELLFGRVDDLEARRSVWTRSYATSC